MFDYDPTDGLPVRKYVLETIKLNQDASLDPNDTANKAATNANPEFPWPDLPLPSFFNDLQPHSQELLRRARQGDQDSRPSVWDKKKQEWVRADKAKGRGLGEDVLKSRHLMNVDLDADQEDVDEEDGEESGDDEFGMTGIVLTENPAGKKRKHATGFEERTIEVKKWVQVPIDKADKMPEPKYLADRRPGMGSLYTPAYLKSIAGFGTAEAAAVQGVAYDLGDGGGLGNAVGSGATAASGQATPVRKNMPPKRKKKKLGGPGRRKAVPVEAMGGEVTAGQVKEGDPSAIPAEGELKKEGEDAEGDDGEDGSGDESEEGSEEGEVNDEPAETAAAVATETVVPAETTGATTEMTTEVAPISVDPVPVDIPIPEVLVEEVNDLPTVEVPVVLEEEKVEGAAPPAISEVAQELAEEVPEEVKEMPAELEVEGEVKMDLLGSVEAAMEDEKTE